MTPFATFATFETEHRGHLGQALRGLIAGAVLLGLAACSSGPPVPDWRLTVHSASERATQAELSGQARVASAEWARARQQATRTAQPEQVARAELARCATQVASLVLLPCTGLDDLQPDMGHALQAYQRYLEGRALPSDVAALPAVQQPLARQVLMNVGKRAGVKPGADEPVPVEGQMQVQILQAMADPLSRLLGAAQLWRAGLASPSVVALAVDTASEQGWVRPLLAWLNVQAVWAEQAGDTATAQRARRRMALLAPVTTPFTPLTPPSAPPGQTAD